MLEADVKLDVRCCRCGYNLRGLASEGRCPECGQPVNDSLSEQFNEGPAWLRKLSIGSLLIGIGVALGAAGAAGAAIRADEQWLWCFPIGAVVSAIGSWQFASITSKRFAPVRHCWLPLLLRVAAIATCTLQVELWLLGWGATHGFGTPGSILAMQLSLLMLLWAIAAAGACIRAAWLAREIGNVSGELQGWMLAILTPALLLLTAAWSRSAINGNFTRTFWIAFTTVAFVIAGWSAVFFAGFSFVLRRAGRRLELAPRAL